MPNLNALTRHVGLNAGPWVLETFVKHYFDQLFKDKNVKTATATGSSGDLRRDELLYDEAFYIVKVGLSGSFPQITHLPSTHTVEELQEFSNARTPSPPWIHVMRLLVPMTCCDDAATYLIEALGGEEKTRQLVGGTKWWQVRGVKGVDSQWIVARKDHQEARKWQKQQEQAERENAEGEEGVYSPEMNELRCILYFHGGGYYFGSIDQERYFLQRFARKSGCRLLAINYRLAPQYPFPCAIQDALAAYLYLIRPPPDALHTPVNPAHIVISGDSAGGGLTFALLQVLRDTNLPMPAGGVLISPWCDLSHSFPSIHTNTNTDVIPKYGLSVYKPSPLWPPPSDDLTNKVQASLRTRIKLMARQYMAEGGKAPVKDESERSPRFWKRNLTFNGRDKHRTRSTSSHRDKSANHPPPTLTDDAKTGDVRSAAVRRSVSDRRDKERDLNIGETAPLPTADLTNDQTITVVTEMGEKLEVHDQVHLYAPNNLVAHPLVSPALSYLGGLPPLHIIASDAEVLRDEIIYSAHKAAHPERYLVKPEARHLYPKLEGIEKRYGPTQVHLQVYDQTAHVLPVLFSFCTPAKFCFRAIALFCKYITGTLIAPATNGIADASPNSKHSNRRSLSLGVSRRTSLLITKRRSTYSARSSTEPRQAQLAGNATDEPPCRASESSIHSSTSSRLNAIAASQPEGIQYAGNPVVYLRTKTTSSPFVDNMIRERVSIRGELRALEAECDLAACTMSRRRYLEGRKKWDEKYARTIKAIRKLRARNLDIAKSETVLNIAQLQMHFFQNADGTAGAAQPPAKKGAKGVKEGLMRSSASWSWAWALDGEERPPPSSIVARRDTAEARRLSKIADQPTNAHDQRMSGNNLWTFLINKLSLEKAHAERQAAGAGTDSEGLASPDAKASNTKTKGWPETPTRAGKRSFAGISSMTSRHDAPQVRAENGDAELGVLDRTRSN
ncbi:alpha/beta-hydrolase [Phellopilus nigrolimitatus]|nr:alpha/beta-hydrolase [Phellopilus nigrolimitatus]